MWPTRRRSDTKDNKRRGSALCMSGSPAKGAGKPAGSVAARFAEEPDKLRRVNDWVKSAGFLTQRLVAV